MLPTIPIWSVPDVAIQETTLLCGLPVDAFPQIRKQHQEAREQSNPTAEPKSDTRHDMHHVQRKPKQTSPCHDNSATDPEQILEVDLELGQAHAWPREAALCGAKYIQPTHNRCLSQAGRLPYLRTHDICCIHFFSVFGFAVQKHKA